MSRRQKINTSGIVSNGSDIKNKEALFDNFMIFDFLEVVPPTRIELVSKP